MEASLPTRIDILQVAINIGGGEKTLRKLLRLYLDNTAECLGRMEEALANRNLLSWLHTAHELKGSSQNITAKRMASLCLEAEEIKTLPHESAAAVLYHMQKELAAIQREIGDLA